MTRSPEDYAHELQALDAAHAQNEAGRDAFIALAHTALFAASVSFVGDVAPLTEAIWRPALILGWSADVVGLLALTVSFVAARRAIDARRAAINDPDPPTNRFCDWLNAIALWSFPVALLCLFSFVTANVVNTDGREIQPTPDAKLRTERLVPSTTSTDLQRGRGWSGSSPSAPRTLPGASPTAPTPAKSAVKETK